MHCATQFIYAFDTSRRKKADTLLHSIYGLLFLKDTDCVFCDVRPKFIYTHSFRCLSYERSIASSKASSLSISSILSFPWGYILRSPKWKPAKLSVVWKSSWCYHRGHSRVTINKTAVDTKVSVVSAQIIVAEELQNINVCAWSIARPLKPKSRIDNRMCILCFSHSGKRNDRPSDFHLFRTSEALYLDVSSDLIRKKRRRWMTGWYSNRDYFSRGIYVLVERWRRFVEHGVTTLRISVIALYLFLQ